MEIIFTSHALFEANRREIPEEIIRNLIMNPQQNFQTKNKRFIIQGKYYNDIAGKEMLLRVIGNKVEDAFKVITVYKTSKIDKYWIKESI